MVIAYGLIKLSITFFYRRMFVTERGSKFDIASKALIITSIIWTLGFALTGFFGCGSNFDYAWGALDLNYYCVTNLSYLEGLMISDFLTDLIAFSLPFPLVCYERSTGKALPTNHSLVMAAANDI